jgi:deoxyribonuclease V
MRLEADHPWDVDYAEARRLQSALARRVLLRDEPGPPRIVTGVDVAFDKAGGRALASAVSFTFPDLEELERADGDAGLLFPYIPGLLSFREGPAVLAALAGLHSEPDLLVFDGQGIAHPRRFGLAAHLGVVTGLPSIGAAKSRLVGEHGDLGEERGSTTPLLLDGEEVGRVVRTRAGVRPLFVSPGHRTTVTGAAELVLACCTRYRLPEPTRAADRRVSLLKKRTAAGG